MAALSSLFAPQFVATKSEEEIAARLREDESLIDADKPCSWVAWYLTGYHTEKGSAIAEHLAPQLPALSHDIKGMIYENLLYKIRRHLKDDPGEKRAEESLELSELSTALKVLVRLTETSIIQSGTSAETVISYLQSRVAPETPKISPFQNDNSSNPAMPPNIPKPPPIPRKRLCYICRLVLSTPHPSQPSMCIPCGEFNISSSQLSTPPNLSLPPTFTALVTGARINLGFHTVLRLLRCGARVIATTRYPRDAVGRYLEETDSGDWRDRLRVVGADFRCAADAFALVRETKRCLRSWADNGEMKLHLLINNAAQTLTDSVTKEEHAVKQEELLRRESKGRPILVEGVYNARTRGQAMPLVLDGTKISALFQERLDGFEKSVEDAKTVETLHARNSSEIEPYTRSSWVQSLIEIPYEDVISAHAVNTFVPLILCRELLPLMGSTTSTRSDPSAKVASGVRTMPEAYIINVSSREGIFETLIDAPAKQGKHVHTNMSKAALNMITETEAASAWKSRRVAMNTVDPGYMSAAPECENSFGGVRPIGWEDGAGRVLWPVAVSQMKGHVVWGRFLKHYGAVGVDPGVGRG
jgi:NAD(P)-dependent dehydrogenase (short-subunit alcohol dehydrogenase family)